MEDTTGEQVAERLNEETTKEMGKAAIEAGEVEIASEIEERVKRGEVNEAYEELVEAREKSQEESSGE